MQRKSSAHYQRVFRQRLREQGLVKKEVWILPENAAALAGIERMLRRPAAGAAHLEKEEDMTEARVWNARSLAEALSGTELFSSGEAQIELIEGAEASLYVIMREYGDLPVFVAPQGEQIIVGALLQHVRRVEHDFVAGQRAARNRNPGRQRDPRHGSLRRLPESPGLREDTIMTVWSKLLSALRERG